MKIAILGYGDQGKSAFDYWNRDGNEITVCDQNQSLANQDILTARLGPKYLEGLAEFDMIVRSPGIHPSDIEAANPDAPDILSKVTTVTNEFFQVCPSKNIIGVTGTKGKGTTSTLVAKMLEMVGKTVHLGGNIGIAPLEMLKNQIGPEDWVVLELANFQLIDLKNSPHLAICLMVVPEHLDWHRDFNEYISAKQQLFEHQTTEDIAIFYPENQSSTQIAGVSPGQKIPYMKHPGAIISNEIIMIGQQQICKTAELKLLGKHNWQNVCAALTAVWQVTKDTDSLRSVLTSFTGLPHRLELVRELDGIKYYDDSFGTTPETAIVAIEAFEQAKVIIVGGSDKGADFSNLAGTIAAGNVRSVVVIGKTGPAIADSLRAAGYTNIVQGGSTMPEIVAAAQAQAQPGDVVLLSTACASFGLFKNYKERGEQFKAAVLKLG